MVPRKRLVKQSFRKNNISSANRRKRMRQNMHKKVLWRQRAFAIREFAAFDDAF
ncbi:MULTISPECIES: hypothetical protein [Salinivibrio]|uniref:Uncharacterized protein n=1 Tax=Salinivibrio kushneri TaxID=1908198 RepID=A0AA47KJR9_9GAMM|nr:MULTISPECIES: hypothetical protein [Salinivibrio]WBA08122.1 hypothetical protein N8M53_09835 [Salinivibrio kushneri]WBA11124.1 hypothetical protein O4546_09900 [Salinivibrio kushneri]WBA17395.1 hypothetical protein O4598_09680 [Salinivibrio kushneri]SIN74799.1 hypothetical protein SAMN05444724_0206 [Salinivibrio sp. ES.052]